MSIPTYLDGFVKDFNEDDYAQMTICTASRDELLEVWYYGELFQVEGEVQPYIVDTDIAPAKIVAKDPVSGAEILIFDGAKHGYNGMFCDEYMQDKLESRVLIQYAIPASKLILTLGYSIDYDDEKEDYDFNDDGNVILFSGDILPWESVKRNGYDYLALSFVNSSGEEIQFADFELA